MKSLAHHLSITLFRCLKAIHPAPQSRLAQRPVLALSLFAAVLMLLSLCPAHAADSHFSDLPGLSGNNSSKPAQAGASATNATVLTANSMDNLDQAHLLAIGDRLSFRIIEDEDDPKPLVVTDSGEIEVPYIGRYPAVGKTCRDVARAVKKELEKDYYFQATVILAVDIMAKSRGKVYIVGPVRAPGPVEIPSDEVLTVSKAILRAGGFTDYADKKDVRVTRKNAGSGEQTFKVNVATILDKGKTENDLKLEAGDLIVVPERSIRF